jgi:hypothetical protein
VHSWAACVYQSSNRAARAALVRVASPRSSLSISSRVRGTPAGQARVSDRRIDAHHSPHAQYCRGCVCLLTRAGASCSGRKLLRSNARAWALSMRPCCFTRRTGSRLMIGGIAEGDAIGQDVCPDRAVVEIDLLARLGRHEAGYSREETVRESRTPESVRAKAEWVSYSTAAHCAQTRSAAGDTHKRLRFYLRNYQYQSRLMAVVPVAPGRMTSSLPDNYQIIICVRTRSARHLPIETEPRATE